MQETPDQQTATQSNSISQTSAISKTSDGLRLTATIARRQWNQFLANARGATPFHRYEFLETLAEHTSTTFHPVVGLRDEQPVGLFPIFEKALGPFTALLSPAPKLKARYLGPVITEQDGERNRSTERSNRAFVDAALAYFADRFSPGYIHLRTAPGYTDHRPFCWAGFEAEPQYSYVVDLTPDAETLLDSFSSDARNNIRTETPDLRIREEGVDAIEPIIEQLQDRHAEQDEPYHVTTDFVTDLYERLSAGIVRPYVVRQDGRYLGGMITLEYGGMVYRWQGGAKPATELPINDLLDWHIMQQAADRGCRGYDLVGANNPRIARYKSKFDPELVAFQRLVSSTRTMALASRLYQRLR